MVKTVVKIMIICRNPAEKRVLAKAASKAGMRLSRFGLEAMYQAAGIPMHERFCKLCSKRLNSTNLSDVCRNCTRTAGTENLRKAAA